MRDEPQRAEIVAVKPYQRGAGEVGRLGWGLPFEGRIWLAAIAAFWAIGWYKGVNLILLLAYVLLILFVVNASLSRWSLRGLRARRGELGDVHAGDPVRWRLDIEAAPHSALGGWSAEERLSGKAIGWTVTHRGEDRLELNQIVKFSQRGVYHTEPTLLWSRAPFGLVRYSASFGEATTFTVMPRCGRLDRRVLTEWLTSATAGDGRRRLSSRATTQEADLHGLRPFRPGDSPRWVHWRTSARRGELMVREFELPDSPDLILVLSEKSDVGDYEAAISLAATVCREWCREPGLRFALLTPSSCSHGLTGAELSHRALSSLAGETGSLSGGWPELPPWEGVPVLVVGSSSAVPIADTLESRLRRPVARADASARLPWYDPPQVNKRASG